MSPHKQESFRKRFWPFLGAIPMFWIWFFYMTPLPLPFAFPYIWVCEWIVCVHCDGHVIVQGVLPLNLSSSGITSSTLYNSDQTMDLKKHSIASCEGNLRQWLLSKLKLEHSSALFSSSVFSGVKDVAGLEISQSSLKVSMLKSTLLHIHTGEHREKGGK